MLSLKVGKSRKAYRKEKKNNVSAAREIKIKNQIKLTMHVCMNPYNSICSNVILMILGTRASNPCTLYVH